MSVSDFELGRLFACQRDESSAQKHFDLILSGIVSFVLPSFIPWMLSMRSGKPLEVSGRKGKYSMEVSYARQRSSCH